MNKPHNGNTEKAMPFGIAFLFQLCYTAFSTGAISLSKRPTLGVRSAVFVNRRSLNKKWEDTKLCRSYKPNT